MRSDVAFFTLTFAVIVLCRNQVVVIQKSRNGNQIKIVLSFYWPLLLTSMLQQFYNFADTWIVGKGLGDNALAAVGNMGSLFFLIVGFSFGLANGFGVPVAQSYEARDSEKLKPCFAAVLELGAVLAIVLSIGSVAFLPHALRLLRTDSLIMEDSLRYGYIVFGGLATGICYNISASILCSLGDSRNPRPSPRKAWNKIQKCRQ